MYLETSKVLRIRKFITRNFKFIGMGKEGYRRLKYLGAISKGGEGVNPVLPQMITLFKPCFRYNRLMQHQMKN